MSGFTRRDVLKTSAALAGLPLTCEGASDGRQPSRAQSEAEPNRITDIYFDLANIYKWDESNGDTWDPFWADDDNLYAFNCDGRGFGKAGRNLAFNRLNGDSVRTLTGSMVNPMDEYGQSGRKEKDGATWKACGQECIDGVFYAFVSRNVYGNDSGDYWLRQTALNSSLIKSKDKGLTWTRTAAENYQQPMWPGAAFGAPFFIHYGRNGGSVKQDGADCYVYALSTNGFWNDGDSYILGRVARTELPNLNAADWIYFRGGDGSAGDAWSHSIEDAQPLLEQRTHCGQSGPCFLPSLNRYLMVFGTTRLSWRNGLNRMKCGTTSINRRTRGVRGPQSTRSAIAF